MRRQGILLLLSCALALGSGSSAFAAAPEDGNDRAAQSGKAARSRDKPSKRETEDESTGPRVFKFGVDQPYTTLGRVAKLVRSGDTVEISPGTYFDCALWPKRVDGLTIVGHDAIFEGATCGGKGIFVVMASNVTIRGITFRGAKVKDGNGAGIRAQGTNLTVEDSRFINNENGILGSAIRESSVIVRNSYFQGNGDCAKACAHGIYIGGVALVRIENSEFVATHRGHHVKSRAFRNEIVGNYIHDGPTGDSSFLIDIPNGGDILISGNRLEKGPLAENTGAAISIGAEAARRGGGNPTPVIRVENNNFTNQMSKETAFIRNFTPAAVALRGNTLQGRVKPEVRPND